MNIKKDFRMARLAKRLNQSEVAEKAGISQSYLSLIEDGTKRAGPELELRIENAINSLAGNMSRSQFLKRIANSVMSKYFEGLDGKKYRWSVSVKGDGLTFKHNDLLVCINRIVTEETQSPAEGPFEQWFSGVVEIDYPDGKKRHYKFLKEIPKIDEFVMPLGVFQGSKVMALLLYVYPLLEQLWGVQLPSKSKGNKNTRT